MSQIPRASEDIRANRRTNQTDLTVAVDANSTEYLSKPTRAASGIPEFDALLDKAKAKAPA